MTGEGRDHAGSASRIRTAARKLLLHGALVLTLRDKATRPRAGSDIGHAI
jgi:hypothetical protein